VLKGGPPILYPALIILSPSSHSASPVTNSPPRGIVALSPITA